MLNIHKSIHKSGSFQFITVWLSDHMSQFESKGLKGTACPFGQHVPLFKHFVV
jgi:hypothetical protein